MRWACIWLFVLAGSVVWSDEYRVGVLYWSMNIPGQVAMRSGLEAEAQKLNAAARASGEETMTLITRVAGDGEEGIENQIRQMNELVAADVDIIVVQPTDNAALSRPLRAANDASIPVVAYDQYISGGKLAAYRSSDNFQAGRLCGEYVADKFDDSTPLRLILVEYPHVSSTVERVNGFLEGLTNQQQLYTVLKSYRAVVPEEGERAVRGILTDYPQRGSVDVVFTVNDGGGLAVVDGLATAGREEIVVASVDGDPASVKNIEEGRLTIIDSAQFCGPLGAEAIRTAHAILQGAHPPYHALVPVFPVTKETLPLYPGWQGPIPETFAKPWPSIFPEWRATLRVVEP